MWHSAKIANKGLNAEWALNMPKSQDLKGHKLYKNKRERPK